MFKINIKHACNGFNIFIHAGGKPIFSHENISSVTYSAIYCLTKQVKKKLENRSTCTRSAQIRKLKNVFVPQCIVALGIPPAPIMLTGVQFHDILCHVPCLSMVIRPYNNKILLCKFLSDMSLMIACDVRPISRAKIEDKASIYKSRRNRMCRCGCAHACDQLIISSPQKFQSSVDDYR